LALQEKIKSEEISIPFVFYDGRCCAFSNFEVNIKLTPHWAPLPLESKKGEVVRFFPEHAWRIPGRREWLRVSVDE